ncbi:Serotransferrin [Acropora cervicornis]|uniref:Serotransferrin n=1 Tax=Acropora cervicornis TaxID=6130 RepID=A0AAD9VH57_ACRCE|nr:Serotransferrin [Acropora cervicornis]
MRWCVLSDQEYAKCMDMKNANDKVAEKLSIYMIFSCVNGTNAEDCMMKIEAGSADLVTLDGGHIKTAGMNHSLAPIVGEDYYNLPGLEGGSYKAVAVVKKSNSNITFEKLKGKTSCHTGAGKTAGWNVPIGTLLRMKLMEQDKSCNAYVSAGKFFSESCVPKTVPAHAVMTRSGHTHIVQFKSLLLGLSAYYGRSQTNSSGFQLFVSSKYGGSNLLFKDSTQKLVDVGDKNTYELWLGNDYLQDLEELDSCPTHSSTWSTSSTSRTSYSPPPQERLAR